MQSVIRIGSRESRLAVKQAEIIKDQIRRCDQTILVEIITMKTTGDRVSLTGVWNLSEEKDFL